MIIRLSKKALLISVLMFFCSTSFALDWTQAMQEKIGDYTQLSESRLAPDFTRVGLRYPTHDLAILIFKNTKRLEIYARDYGPWRYIRSYHILAASGGPGPKLHVGDHQVPEGIYHIIGLNPESHFDLSMHLNYPNAFDRMEARLHHRTNLGGDIFIHGNDRSIGCVAIGNHAIQEVFPLVYYAGFNHVEVIIAPNDFRKGPPIYGRVHPVWLPQLYARIGRALRVFPEPR